MRATALHSLIAFVGLALATTSAYAQTDASSLPAGLTEVTAVEGITEYQLDNGLRVLLFPDASKQQITVNITYLVGSLHEGYGETGMAHLLEHLVFKGTPNHPDIPKELSERGANPNGSTWYDRTNYFETFPATEDNLRWALDLESDRMINSFIAKKDLDSEMTVVRNEWESGENSPFGVLMDRVLSAAYLWHNYGKTTIGARADIENVPIDRLKAFYRKYYQPDNAVLVVAGNFETNVALDMIAELFGAIPRPERVGADLLYPTYTAEPAQDGERTVTLRRVGDTHYVVTAHHIPAGSDPLYPAVDVLSHVLGNEPSGRLYKNLVESKLAASAASFAFQLKEPGVLLNYAEVRKDGSLPDASLALFATLEELKEAKPATEDEVERAKNAYLTTIELAFNNPQRLALQLSEWAAMGDWRLLFLYRDGLEKVTPADVQTAANAYLLDSNRTVGWFYPAEETPPRAEIPPKPNVAELVEGYEGREAASLGEDFDPSPANIQARTTVHRLANGLKVALLPKETRGDSVTISLEFPFGTVESLTNQSHNAILTHGMLMRGTTKRTRQEIQDELNRIKTRLSIGGGNWSVSAGLTTVREQLPAALALLEEVLKQPAFDQTEFDLLVEESLAGIESNMSEPQFLAGEAYRRYLVSTVEPGHPFYYYSAQEDIDMLNAITLEDVEQFWRTFYSSTNGSLALVGDFDADEVLALLEDAFGDWEASTPYEHIAYEHLVQDAVELNIETPDKSNAIMYAALNMGVYEEHQDYPAFRIGMEVLGGGFLSSRLATRIRQNEGLSYGVGARMQLLTPDPTSLFLAYAIYAPQNRDRLVAAFREEIERLLNDGVEQEELAAAIKGYLDFQQNLRANDANVANQLAANLRFDRTMEFTAEIEAAMAELTADDVRAAMTRHLIPERIAIFRAGDFANNPVAQ
ncbi:MAG: insulinase family protein [Gammaproteobacteria bacterium]|nr:insulinase family protein [Gammaproteobacteria bacterium]